MSGLLGPNGKPISSAMFNKKESPPKFGEAFGAWAGRDIQFMNLPGGGVVQFDLSKLTLQDYRSMRDHYQVNASQAVLTFMQHQSEYHIVCEDKKIADECEEQLNDIWTPLNRSMGTSNWAGFSPNALNWENDVNGRRVVLDKIKDLVPEECHVNWKLVKGWAPPGMLPPEFKVYDGIKQWGVTSIDDEGRVRRNSSWPIPVENSFWFPLLMENGDYYGRKLLKPAFTSWFFSVLLHLFANRYYERFGEPTPIGRAPFDEEWPDENSTNRTPGNVAMLSVLANLRNRGAVVLPNTRTPTGDGNQSEWEYDIEYLESQMRGADFERYMTRLDEEISLGIFTPILLMRTADVGSYNLGVGHMQVWLWMINALNGDRKHYIDKYILSPMVNFNFSKNAPRAKIVFKKLGNQNIELIQAILTALVSKDKVMPDIVQLGEMAGLTLKQIKEVTSAPDAPNDPAGDSPAPDPGSGGGANPQASITIFKNKVHEVGAEIVERVRPQVEKAFRSNKFDEDLTISMGYKNAFEVALHDMGNESAKDSANDFYERMDSWLADVVALGAAAIEDADTFMTLFKRVLNSEIELLEAS